MAEILLYTESKEKADRILKICKEKKVRLIRLAGQDAGKTVGALVRCRSRVPEAAAVPALYRQREIMILSGFSPAAREEFLDLLKERQVPDIALKAIVTVYNAGWTVMQLTEELSKEHDRLSGPLTR